MSEHLFALYICCFVYSDRSFHRAWSMVVLDDVIACQIYVPSYHYYTKPISQKCHSIILYIVAAPPDLLSIAFHVMNLRGEYSIHMYLIANLLLVLRNSFEVLSAIIASNKWHLTTQKFIKILFSYNHEEKRYYVYSLMYFFLIHTYKPKFSCGFDKYQF